MLDLLPGGVFGIGLSMTVAPLTATVSRMPTSPCGIARASQRDPRAGRAVAVAAVGAVGAASFAARLEDSISD